MRYIEVPSSNDCPYKENGMCGIEDDLKCEEQYGEFPELCPLAE